MSLSVIKRLLSVFFFCGTIGLFGWFLHQQQALEIHHRNATLVLSIANDDTQAALQALKEGADPNARGLMYLLKIENGDGASDALLLDAQPGKMLFPALMIAAAHGNVQVVKALLDRGADVNARMASDSGAEGYTALIYACTVPKPEIVKMLLDKGADVHAVADYNKTALQFAKSLHYAKIVRLLTQAGAKF